MLKNLYNKKSLNELVDAIGCKNIMEVPKIIKVCINVGFSSKVVKEDSITAIASDLALIACQKPVVTRAKKSISGFSLRKNDPIGCKVTLRKNLMYNFLDRLLYIALPREKDFRGFRDSQFDGNGNLSFGIKEHVIFPEIKYESVSQIFGMDITIVTNSKNDSHSKILLSALCFPFT